MFSSLTFLISTPTVHLLQVRVFIVFDHRCFELRPHAHDDLEDRTWDSAVTTGKPWELSTGDGKQW